MKKIIPYILFLSLVVSCTSKQESKDVKPENDTSRTNLTVNEAKGLKEIVDFYGGHCKYSVGLDKEKKYFEIELNESASAEQFKEMTAMPASNMAYLFFKDLKEEQNTYDEILSTLALNDGVKKTFRYSKEQLAAVDQHMNTVYKIAGLIKEKDYEALRPLIQEKVFSVNVDEVMSKLKVADSLFGNVTTGFKPYGFAIKKAETGMDILHISGIIARDKQSHEYSVDMDLNTNDGKIFFIQFKF